MESDTDNNSDPFYDDRHPSWYWKEANWQDYLCVTDTQIRQFCTLYHLLIDDPERLDKIAVRMGWAAEGWQSGETAPEDGLGDEIPYTIHLHPVYTVTRGIFRSLCDLSMAFAHLNGYHARLQLSILCVLHEAETQALLGIESQDMGDMPLTVCHFKRSLAQLNYAMTLLTRMAEEKIPGADLYDREAKKRIFDLREIWLRINSETREEMQKRENTGE